MAPRTDYAGQACSVARALEIVGERWTILIVRDAFHGVRRFGDFAAHLEIPRAVLASRLKALVEEEVLLRVPGSGGHDEYELSAKGAKLWPVVRELMSWGDEYYAPHGRRRILRHANDGGELSSDGACSACGAVVGVEETLTSPGPGFEGRREDIVSVAFREPRRLLTPVRG
jgi:DNA-binding HxlR family transcriptional regulator